MQRFFFSKKKNSEGGEGDAEGWFDQGHLLLVAKGAEIWGHASYPRASLVAQSLKRLPAIRETRVRSLGGEDPLEKEMATTPVFLPGESHGGRSLVGYRGSQRVGHDWATSLSLSCLSCFHGGGGLVSKSCPTLVIPCTVARRIAGRFFIYEGSPCSALLC